MANGEEKNSDFYAVLGLNKECTATELRNAYKKLAMRWHPDRCSASGNSKFVEEAKKKFQAIQQAYSVLSDANKRFLYDVGVYDSDDDENGMGDFLNEMAAMMNQTKPNGEESFEELKELFEEMFQGDIEAFGSSCQVTTSCSSSSSCASYSESSNSNNKRNSSEMNSGKTKAEGTSSCFDTHFQSFCLGLFPQGIPFKINITIEAANQWTEYMSYAKKMVEHQQDFRNGKVVGGEIPGGAGGRRRHGRKQKVSSGHDVSTNDSGISAS